MDAAFLTHGVHVNVKPYSPDNVEEIEAPVTRQCSKCVGKQPSHFETSAGKKRTGQPIEYIIDAIMEFTNMSRKRRSDKDNNSRKTTVESALVGDRFSMDKVIAILNSIENVDDYTMFKVLNKLHKSNSKATFIMLKPNRRSG